MAGCSAPITGESRWNAQRRASMDVSEYAPINKGDPAKYPSPRKMLPVLCAGIETRAALLEGERVSVAKEPVHSLGQDDHAELGRISCDTWPVHAP